MRRVQVTKLAIAGLVAALVVCVVPAIADEIRGRITSVDPATQTIVVHDEKTKTDVTVSLAALGQSKGLGKSRKVDFKTLKVGTPIVVSNAIVAANIEIIPEESSEERAPPPSLLAEFWDNFKHNLFKPLLLVPAVQHLAIPEASPTLPLAASLGLTFSYNVTIGIPVYIMVTNIITRKFTIA